MSTIPEFEPEVREAMARRLGAVAPTTIVGPIFQGRTLIESAFHKAEEFRAMLAMIQNTPLYMRDSILSMRCKTGNVYRVFTSMADRQNLEDCARAMEQALLQTAPHGHNGVVVVGLFDRSCNLPEKWLRGSPAGKAER